MKRKDPIFYAPTTIKPWENKYNAFSFSFSMRSLASTWIDAVILIFFVFGFLLVPFTFDTLISFGFVNPLGTTGLVTKLIVPLIAFFVIFLFDNLGNRRLVKSGGFAFFLFYFLFNALFPYVIIPIVVLFAHTYSNLSLNVFITLIQDLFEIGIVIFTFGFAKHLRSRFLDTWCSKQSPLATSTISTYVGITFLTFIIVSIIGLFTTFLVTNLHFLTNNNQSGINRLLVNPWGGLVVIPLTLLIAPFAEELSTRHGIFQIVKNRYFAAVCSLLFFSEMHVTNDIYDIYQYIGAALIFVTVYIVTNYNVTYTIFAHSFYNSVVTAVLLFTLKVNTTYFALYIVCIIGCWLMVALLIPYLIRRHRYKLAFMNK